MVSEGSIKRDFDEAIRQFPGLSPPRFHGSNWIIDGNIDVTDSNGGYWDTYQVSIIITSRYPDALPILKETGGKIEKHEDWHNSFGECCLSTPAIMFTQMKGVTLLKWLKQFVHPYLANHVYKLKTGQYAHGEFAHGAPGIFQGYQTLFGIENISDIIHHLQLLVGLGQRNQKCFCKSGKKYKRCFLKYRMAHTLIPQFVLEKDLVELKRLQLKIGRL